MPALGRSSRSAAVLLAAATADERIVAAIASAVAANIERLSRSGRLADAEWWQTQLDWVEQHRGMLTGT